MPFVRALTLAAAAGLVASGAAPKGPLLGQGRPGPEPALFAPGIVNDGLPVRDLAVSPDGREIVWSVCFPGGPSVLVGTREEEGGWTAPETLPFARDPERSFLEPCFGPDGATLFFGGDGGRTPDGRTNWDLFAVSRTLTGWGIPRPVEGAVNTEANEYFPSVTADGILYFCRDEMPRGRAHFLYRAKRTEEGSYPEAVRLPAPLNALPSQFNAFVARDESLLLFSAVPGSGGVGGVDYLVSFRREDGAFSEPVVLAPPVSTRGSEEFSASLSPGGSALFFMSTRGLGGPGRDAVPWTLERLRSHGRSPGSGRSGIWWLDASFLERLRAEARFPDGPGRGRSAAGKDGQGAPRRMGVRRSPT